MINVLIRECDVDLTEQRELNIDDILSGDVRVLARLITTIEAGALSSEMSEELKIARSTMDHRLLGSPVQVGRASRPH